MTGGAGFIGAALVGRLLAEGHTVDVVDDLSVGTLGNLAAARAAAEGRLTFHQLDIRLPDVISLAERHRPDVVYHLAAAPPGGNEAPGDAGAGAADEGVGDAGGGVGAAGGGVGAAGGSQAASVVHAETDVIGSLQVIEASRRAGATKVVFASSAAVYGDVTASELPLKEGRGRSGASSAQGVAKRAVGEYLRLYRDRFSLEYTILVLADVYGPGQDPRRHGGMVAALASRIVAGRGCTIEGDGTQTRDFVFVDDVVDAFARAAGRGGGLEVNVATGVETSVNDLYGAMAASAGTPAEAEHVATGPVAPRRLALDPARAAIHLGWTSWTSVLEGIDATLEWWQSLPSP